MPGSRFSGQAAWAKPAAETARARAAAAIRITGLLLKVQLCPHRRPLDAVEGASGFPDRRAGSGQAQARPQVRNRVDHGLVHADLPAPVAGGLRRPLVGGVEADLAAKAALR